MYVIVSLIISAIICSSFINYYAKKQNRRIQQIQAHARQQALDERMEDLQKIDSQIKDKLLEKQELTNSILSLESFYKNFSAEKEKIDKECEEYVQKKKEELNVQYSEMEQQQQSKIEELGKKKKQIEEEIIQYQLKQKSINEDILRRRQMTEQKDFYRVVLQPEALDDISLLKETRKNLKKPEIVDKLIYDNYVAKPVLEMEKRVLSNNSFSGIYKITCLSTKEVYIGKSTDIKARWQQHCKTAFNCGTIASSLLHTKMKEYGIENFTFEVLERVPKENLSEREKYYINFYQTKEVGFNERIG